MKISFLGAGSVGFTQTLVRDILKVKKLQNIEISLHDISRSNLLMVAELIQKDITANNLPTKLSIDPIRKESIKNAKYIISCVRVGGLEAFETDISIPLKYGIDQCVGVRLVEVAHVGLRTVVAVRIKEIIIGMPVNIVRAKRHVGFWPRLTLVAVESLGNLG